MVTVLLDWLVTVGVVMLALVFGLVGACFLLVGVGGVREIMRFPLSAMPGSLLFIALGIALLMLARTLIRYLRRRRETLRGRTSPAPPTGDR